MPFALIIVGAAFLVAGVRNKQDDLFRLVRNDFTGPNNFIFWVISILAIGAVGYIPKLKPISDGFLALVILVLILARGNPSNVGGGFFQQFTAQTNTTTQTNLSPYFSQVQGTGPTSMQVNNTLAQTSLSDYFGNFSSLPTTH
jgi:hypothetical protein